MLFPPQSPHCADGEGKDVGSGSLGEGPRIDCGFTMMERKEKNPRWEQSDSGLVVGDFARETIISVWRMYGRLD